MPKFILSVDAGGIRALIPALILSELEKRTKKPISQMFNLMAGTSTGGMLVAALCATKKTGGVYSATEVVEILQSYAPTIFETNSLRKSVSKVFKAEKLSENIDSLLHKYFGESVLADTSTNLLLTTFDIKRNLPYFLKSWKKDRNHLLMSDAIRATTSSITHFLPSTFVLNGKTRILLDGSIFAYNPSLCAYASGKSLFPQEEIIVLSLGTGRLVQDMNNPSNLAKLGWIDPIIDFFLSAGIDTIDYQMNKIIGENYFRIQMEIPVEVAGMESSSDKNMKQLKDIAQSWIKENDKVLSRFTL